MNRPRLVIANTSIEEVDIVVQLHDDKEHQLERGDVGAGLRPLIRSVEARDARWAGPRLSARERIAERSFVDSSPLRTGSARVARPLN